MMGVGRFILDRMGASVHSLPSDGRSEVRSSLGEVAGPSDAELLASIRAGDKGAFRALYGRYQTTVCAMALHRGCPEAEAEDVVHEVFMAIWRRPPDLGANRLTTWLYRVLANQVSSLHRRRRVRQLFASESIAQAPASTSGDAATSAEERDLVRAVLARMSPKKREVLVLYEVEGRSGTEIAELVGCRTNTVWTRLHHAREEFRRLSERLGALDEEVAP